MNIINVIKKCNNIRDKYLYGIGIECEFPIVIDITSLKGNPKFSKLTDFPYRPVYLPLVNKKSIFNNNRRI